MKFILFQILNMGIVLLSLISCKEKEYQLVWQDEFDYTGLPDIAKWSYDTAGNNWQWGNNELQYYTHGRKENAWVSDGFLTITA